MKKIALCVGINYANHSSMELYGCVNDAENIKKMLVNRMGYDEDNVSLLLEEHATRYGILRALCELTVLAKRVGAEECWISYSGHGTGTYDASGDENDGRDECIVPYSGGHINDDRIHEILQQMPSHTRTTIMWDCCYSGTGGDLEYHYHFDNGGTLRLDRVGRPLAAPVIMVSGCNDRQTSSDAWGLQGKTFTGAMTSSMLNTLAQHRDVTVQRLVSDMRSYLKEHNFTQIPQVTSSRPIDEKTLFTSASFSVHG